MKKKKLNLTNEKFSFGTDGWRGILGVDFTLDRLLKVAAAAAQELAFTLANGFSYLDHVFL